MPTARTVIDGLACSCWLALADAKVLPFLIKAADERTETK